MIMERKIKLETLNKHITCKICCGYFIEAVCILECLHTCKYLQNLLGAFLFIYFKLLRKFVIYIKKLLNFDINNSFF